MAKYAANLVLIVAHFVALFALKSSPKNEVLYFALASYAAVLAINLVPPIIEWLRTACKHGILHVFPRGTTGDYKHLRTASTISFLSISLRGLHEVQEHIIAAISNNRATVHILILNPNSSFLAEREKQEGDHRIGEIKKESEITISQVAETAKRLSEMNVRGGAIELRTYDTMPYCSCVLTDTEVRYTPYIMQLRAGSSMMLRLRPKSPIAQDLAQHYERIWSKANPEFKKVWS